MSRFITIATRDIPDDYTDWIYLRDEDINDCEYNFCILDTVLKTVVGTDGGEPEDQILCRDWSWVVEALNHLNEEKHTTAHVAENVDLLQIHARLYSRETNGKD